MNIGTMRIIVSVLLLSVVATGCGSKSVEPQPPRDFPPRVVESFEAQGSCLEVDPEQWYGEGDGAARYRIHHSRWQTQDGTGWLTIPGTERNDNQLYLPFQGIFQAQKCPVATDRSIPLPLPLRQLPAKPSSSIFLTLNTVYAPS